MMAITRLRRCFCAWRAICRMLMACVAMVMTLMPHPAHAACIKGACITAGPRLASVDSTRGILLNGLMSGLLGSSVNLTVADWNALATGQVNLASFAQALQAQTGASTPATALGAQASVAQIVSAAATAAQADGQTATAAALGRSVAQLGPLTGTISLGDMLNVSLPDGALSTASLNALELLSGSAQLYNMRNVLTTPTPISLNGSGLNLGGLSVGQIDLYAQVVEPPVYVCGGVGSTFHTATIRIKLNVSLLQVNVDGSSLNGLGGASAVSIALNGLQLFLEVARAEGTLAAIDAMARAVTVEATPGVVDLYVGSIADALFFNRGHVIQPNVDLGYAPLGALTLNLGLLGTTTVGIEIRAYARGQTSGTRVLNFTGPYPQTRTASTSLSFVSTLLSDLIGSLSVRLQPSLGTTVDALLLDPLKALLLPVLNSLLSGLLGNVADPLLESLGVGLGEVDVSVDGTMRACDLSGYVYSDVNHNASREGSEVGCGTTLYAKLVSASAPSGPVVAVSTVDAASGRYDFSGLIGGSYTLLIDTSNVVSDVTPGLPAGWIGTDAPVPSRALILSGDTQPQNFGIFHGSKAVGTVFVDTGAGGATANDGQQQGAEKGLAGAGIQVLSDAGLALDTTTSGVSGQYTVWVPASAAGTQVRIAQTNAPGYVSVGGSAGGTQAQGGVYDRATDMVRLTADVGQVWTGVNFGDVPDNMLTDDGQQNIVAGASVVYPHTFVAGSAGQLGFVLDGQPGTPWSTALYVDVDCNATLGNGDTPWAGTLNMVAGQKVCLLVKIVSPPGVPTGTQHAATLTATFTYTTAAFDRNHARHDTTVIGNEAAAGLKLVKLVDKASAKTGDVLVYTIRYSNLGQAPLSQLKLNDSTPVYTAFVSAACAAPLPTGITRCALSVQPAAGAVGPIEWTMDGQLPPGAQGEVSYSVTVQ